MGFAVMTMTEAAALASRRSSIIPVRTPRACASASKRRLRRDGIYHRSGHGA